VLIFFLTLFGIVTPKFLIQNTKYAVLLVITVVAAIVTPTPDASHHALVRMKRMTLLYFVGVGVSWLVVRHKNAAWR
jgi:sec-independent protein translocase protein TatC